MGGGGDGGYQAKQDQIDASKQNARSKLNELFGVSTPGAAAAPVDRSGFYRSAPAGQDSDPAALFDQAGYDAAVAAGQPADTSGEVAKNKSALDALYGQVRTDAYTAGKRRIDEQKQNAGRDLKFELFARGQNGGSTDIDQNAILGRTYSQGITDLGAKADGVATQLRGDNEQARLQLLQSIDSGMDQSSALSSALGQMRVNSDRSAADATGTAIGDLFANTGLIYQQNRVAQGKQNYLTAAAQNGTPSGRGSNGILTATR